MPACGYALGREFVGFIQSVDHFVAFGILGFLGAKMIKQSRSRVQSSLNLGLGALFLAAFATSVDALAVGVTMGFSEINIVSSAVIIGIVCFAISVIASLVGNKLGQMLGSKALVLGGIILILIGLKILISHLLE